MFSGALVAFLRDGRQEGASWDELSRRVYGRTGLTVSADTLNAWSKQLGLTEAEAVA